MSTTKINWNNHTITDSTYTTGNVYTNLHPVLNIGTTMNSNPYTIRTTDNITIGEGMLQKQVLSVLGDAEFSGDIKLKGKSLINSLEKIEEKLAILHPNEKLEEKYEKLRELRKQYIELEKEIIEKEKIWDILQK